VIAPDGDEDMERVAAARATCDGVLPQSVPSIKHHSAPHRQQSRPRTAHTSTMTDDGRHWTRVGGRAGGAAAAAQRGLAAVINTGFVCGINEHDFCLPVGIPFVGVQACGLQVRNGPIPFYGPRSADDLRNLGCFNTAEMLQEWVAVFFFLRRSSVTFVYAQRT
jgi:hypothetical protein